MSTLDKAVRTAAFPLYITDWHSCSYLPNLSARTLFVDPAVPMDGGTYQVLLSQGFRRSGVHFYRPVCGSCQRCIPVRIPVQEFAPNRSQHRNQIRNREQIVLRHRPARFDPEHYELYRYYALDRHREGSMSDTTPESYIRFLVAPWGGETHLLELRLGTQLMAVAVTDLLPECLSAVYTFYDPALAKHAPGIYAILCQIEEARRLRFEHLYLGYWIGDCRKMSYKEHFRPLEARIGEVWRRYGRGAEIC